MSLPQRAARGWGRLKQEHERLEEEHEGAAEVHHVLLMLNARVPLHKQAQRPEAPALLWLDQVVQQQALHLCIGNGCTVHARRAHLCCAQETVDGH